MKKTWSLVLTGLLTLFSLTGCAISNSSGEKEKTGVQTQSVQQEPHRSRNSILHGFKTRNVNEHNYRKGFTTNGYNQNQAELLTRYAHDVSGVVRASAVVNGRDAIVGIIVRKELPEQQVRKIQQQVQAAASARLPQLNIRVTADREMFQRLRALNAAIYEEARLRKNNVRINALDPQTSLGHDFRLMLDQLQNGFDGNR